MPPSRRSSAAPIPAELLALAVDTAREAAGAGGPRPGHRRRARRRQVQPGRRRHRRRPGQRGAGRRAAARRAPGRRRAGGGGRRRGRATSGVRWVVDPIDGTVNFLYGLPAYAVSIAAEVDGSRPRRRGAQRRHRRAVHGDWPAAARWLTLPGAAEPVPLRGQPRRRRWSRRWWPPASATGPSSGGRRGRSSPSCCREVRDIRRYGSSALDLCSLAAGRVDAYYELGLKPWDHAAGGAGGRRGRRRWSPACPAGRSPTRMAIAAAPSVAERVRRPPRRLDCTGLTAAARGRAASCARAGGSAGGAGARPAAAPPRPARAWPAR